MKTNTKIKAMMVLILVLVCVFVSLNIGSYPLSFEQIVRVLIQDPIKEMDVQVFYQLRLPRVLMGLMCGFTFGLCGAIFQLMFHNPLASPDLIGVSSGASLGAACMIVLGAGSVMEIMAGSFLGGMLILGAVIALVKVSGSPRNETYVLAGIAASALANALIMMLKIMADSEGELAAIEFWTMGSLATITLDKFLSIAGIVLVSLVLLGLLKKEILILGMGDQNAHNLGMNHDRMRIFILTCCTLAASAIISLTGIISFVGLIAPHLAYLIFKSRTQNYFMMSALIGGILVLCADCFARSLTGGELPTSIFTTFCAIPFFIYFLCRRKGAIR